MNKERRKKVERLFFELEELIEQEQEAFDNLPESIQSSQKGETFEENICAMETARDELAPVIEDDQ